MKKSSSLVLSGLVAFLMSGCSGPTVTSTNNSMQQLTMENNTYIAKLSNSRGAEIPVKINFNPDSNFNVKANVSGTVGLQPSDIAKVDVYLFKLASNFTGTDPAGTSMANVVTSFTNVAKTGNSFNMTFKNVPGLSGGLYYWIGVIAKDSNGTIISKPPSTAWTGSTNLFIPALALSTGGVGVDPTTLVVTSTSNLTVTVPLLGSVGAQISADANVTSGSSSLTDANITVQ